MDAPEIVTGRNDPEAVEGLLRALPEWFGIEDSLLEYVEAARSAPTYLAVTENEVVGVLLLARHFPAAAEVTLMAVGPSHHRRGVGTTLLAAAERDLVAGGCELLQVKTLGPSHPDTHYAATRRFYAARGFRPVEELTDLWPGNPCLIMIKVLAAERG